MRYAEYILKLKNLYIFYTTYILSGLVDVLGIYLRYDNIGDILLQNVTTLVYVQVMGLHWGICERVGNSRESSGYVVSSSLNSLPVRM